tara:strand:- start:152 stop:391 length:240 start_codon:yes stop_codon:yes gene_type:complete
MFITPSTNFLKNSCLVLVLSVVFFYQKDESFNDAENIPINQINFEEIYKKKSLQNQIRMGFFKHRLKRLKQSANDTRQL